jgi:hypothetical protein
MCGVSFLLFRIDRFCTEISVYLSLQGRQIRSSLASPNADGLNAPVTNVASKLSLLATLEPLQLILYTQSNKFFTLDTFTGYSHESTYSLVQYVLWPRRAFCGTPREERCAKPCRIQ